MARLRAARRTTSSAILLAEAERWRIWPGSLTGKVEPFWERRY
jgi:hypothetical protein